MAITYFDHELFTLSALIVNINIKLSARIECGVKQLLSLVTSNGELVLHYTFGGLKPVVKRIPWFDDQKKIIQHICFDPTATWLLVLTLDSSLYIVPALKILDPEQKIDCKWSVSDLTHFPKTSKSPDATPGCVIWWQTLDCNQNAIVGYDSGEICFVSLTDGQVIGVTSITGPVMTLNICQDNSLDSVTLLVTSESKQQWRLLLEQRSTSYIWSAEGGLISKLSVNSDLSMISSTSSSEGESKVTRSRLQGLKQMSVEKLTTLRQKLAETRAKSMNLTRKDTNSVNFIKPSNGNDVNNQTYDINQPEKLTNLGETFLKPQYAKNRHLFSGYFNPTSLLTIHGVEVDGLPLYVHKLHCNCRDILMTDRFFFTVDQNYNSVSIVSCQLSEARLDGDCEFNQDALIATFELPNKNEIVLAMYKLTDITLTTEKSNSDSANKQESLFTLPKTVQDLHIRNPKVDTCVIVTNFGVYKIILKCSVIQVFMYFVCEENNIEKAEKLALIFGLNLQQLLEQAGDLLLANSRFVEAISLYKLSRCRLLKSVLKFAVAGNANELLTYIQTCLAAPNIDISLPTKIHLSNLAVMSYTEKHLRLDKYSRQKSKNFKEFVDFLSRNDYYDQVLAVNVLCQTALWNLMTILIRIRGLVYDVLETICKLIKSSNAGSLTSSSACDFNDKTLYMCLTEPINLQCLLVKPIIAKIYFNFIRTKLDMFEAPILQRLVELLDPSKIVARPVIAKLFEMYKSRRRDTSSMSFDSTFDSQDSTESNEEQLGAFQDLVETFITVILKRIHMYHVGPIYNNNLMTLSKYSFVEDHQESIILPRKYRTLSTGYAHVALIRNNLVWMWGITSQGCLGLGPLMTKYHLPQSISTFNYLWSDIISISCGRMHTLILTNYGVYTCGSNTYGQLGLQNLMQTPYPIMIESISNDLIVDVCAGQYHSLALTASGKVYSWGWGVHGQLGHGDVEDVRVPKQIDYFKDIIVAQIAAGHAHSLALTTKGIVYSFGSNFFGQLGIGTNRKHNIPQQVTKIPEKIVLISTEYFQNFAVSVTNKLYTWGASPQVLRLAAQAQKKAKLLNQTNAVAGDSSIVCRSESNLGNLRSTTSPEDIPLPSDENSEEKTNEVGDINKSDKELLQKIEKEREIIPDDSVEAPVVDPDIQPHLQPRIVNTSNVNGVIVNVVSGCHHAALLTKDGTLYTWGKNLDGQLGTGSRKEVLIPTAVKINPANFVSGVNSPVRQDDSNLQELKCSYVSCGAEFTIAIDSTGRILAWGNNAFAQLGKLPDEDQKGLDGKMVLLRTTKRIIKLPSSFQNICEIPKEILNIPSQVISFKNVDKKLFPNYNQSQFYPLTQIEDDITFNTKHFAKYGPKTLHFVLETYRGFYDSDKMLKQCLKYSNYQAASKISFLECYFTDSLSYQLKGLEKMINKKVFVQNEKDLKPNFATNSELKMQTKANEITVDLGMTNGQLVVENSPKEPTDLNVVRDTDISFSPSLESIKQFNDDLESQGGEEEMYDDIPEDIRKLSVDRNCVGDIDDDKKLLVRNTILEYVDSIDKKFIDDDTALMNVENNLLKTENNNGAKIESISKKNKVLAMETSSDIENRNSAAGDTDIQLVQVADTAIVDYASQILMFYIEKTQNTENHILMQNILIKSMDFWLTNNLPVDILENILLKNMAKYFYPLSVLLFCKNFNNNDLDEAITKSECAASDDTTASYHHHHTSPTTNQSEKSFLFLKQLSTKFCLQLCSMVLKNVHNSKSNQQEN